MQGGEWATSRHRVLEGWARGPPRSLAALAAQTSLWSPACSDHPLGARAWGPEEGASGHTQANGQLLSKGSTPRP